MKKIIKLLKLKNMESGYLYFYIHFITEIVCFFALSRIVRDVILLWTIPFMYDALSFVPQSLIGYFSDKHPKINLCLYGIIILVIGFICFSLDLLPGDYTEIILICIGNALIHVNGAEVTLTALNGKMSASALFVSGGAFGVITGKLLGSTSLSFWIIAGLALTMIPFALLAEYYKKYTQNEITECKNFNYHNDKINPGLVVLFAVLIVIVRSYMGYGIPTSWNKTVLQSILLYSFMGIGKALGGILCDTIGIRKTAIISIAGSLPFLLFGDRIMMISLFGILLFSMTMSITLALLVSVLKKRPGLAFGLTTIGLFLGTVPIFFIEFNTVLSNCIVISILTIISLILALIITTKEEIA